MRWSRDWSSDVCSSDLDRFDNFIEKGVDQFCGRISSHAAGIWPGVVFADLFVVLARWKNDKILSGNHQVNRSFRSEERRVGSEWISPCLDYLLINTTSH